MGDELEEIEFVLASSLDEFLRIYSSEELAKILIKNVNFKDLCTVMNEL